MPIVLCVDDDATYLETLAVTLQRDGQDVATARSGEEALELLAVLSVDCIVLEVGMPGIDGYETCRRIKATPSLRDVPLVLLTAREERDAELEGLAAGADDYIAKSSAPDVVRARIRAQVQRKKLEDATRAAITPTRSAGS